MKAPGEEGEVALMDDHKREPSEVGEGVEMDMQSKLQMVESKLNEMNAEVRVHGVKS